MLKEAAQNKGVVAPPNIAALEKSSLGMAFLPFSASVVPELQFLSVFMQNSAQRGL